MKSSILSPETLSPEVSRRDNLAPYLINGTTLYLETSPEVFAPTSTSQAIGKILDIPPKACVLDLGCGVGNLAIYAALRGAGQVYAVDIMGEACRLARRNAAHNEVENQVDVRCGHLFEPVSSLRFDVIIDDVSGIAEEVAGLSGWFPNSVPTGGRDGTDHVIAMLAQAKEYLKPGGVLYLPISSLSDSGKILRAATDAFEQTPELLSQTAFPFCPELRQHMDTMETLKQGGVIDFHQRGSRPVWTLSIFRMRASIGITTASQAIDNKKVSMKVAKYP